jgi:hypothetical protein
MSESKEEMRRQWAWEDREIDRLKEECERLRIVIYTIADEAEQLGMPKLAAHWRREVGDE